MKRILFILTLFMSLSAQAQQESTQFFQLPLVPDSIKSFQRRADYYIQHYWDFCDLKKAFSARDKMSRAFYDYMELMPHASADAVFSSVDAFMSKLSKQPKDMLFIGELAEGMLYSDTAVFASDELYIHFLEPIVRNKKIDKNSKLRYQHQLNILNTCQPGMTAPAFDYVDIDGANGRFEADSSKLGTILFFNDPDCTDCNLARIRLDADILTNRLVDAGKIDIISIYPGEPGFEWSSQAITYPKAWKTVASPDIDELYDLRHSPAFYLLNPNGSILMKTSDVNVILDIMARIAPVVRTPRAKPAEN